MPGTAGKKARVKVSTTAGGGGVYNVVQGVKSFNHSIDGASIDDSELGVDWAQRIQGLKDGKLSITLVRRLGDTNGQNAILSALLNDTELWYQVLPDNGTTASVGFKQQCVVSKFNEDGAVDGGIGVTIELEGTGPITLV